jgi:choline dehydrogenase-like flavoprotein
MHRVCIVGSGFAGTALALRLVEQGVDTVLLEAGPRLPPGAPPGGALELFPHRAYGDAVPAIDVNRTIGLGGTSRIWSGVVTRMLPNDFRTRAEFGFFADWPLAYEDLAAYYPAAERLLATHGAPPAPEREPPRAESYPVEWPAGQPAAPAEVEDLGTFPLAFGTREGAPLRLDEVELPRFAASPFGTLQVERPVVRLVCEDGRSVTAAETRRPDGSIESFRARHFVIAAGVFETARLLLASPAPGHPTGLGNRHDRVGRYVHGHPRYRREVARHPRDSGIGAVHRSYAFADRLRREGLGALAADLNFGGARPAIDVTAELEPAAENRVFLDPSWRDSWDRPGAVIACDSTARDRLTRERARALVDELAARVGGPDTVTTPPTLTWLHPAGTCRMAHRADSGVVDSDGRVFGLDNLFLAGAAVFPTSGPANPTSTLVALALRLGDHLRELAE